MARTRSVESINAEIKKLENELDKLQTRQDAITSQLLTLQNKKKDYEAKQIMEAFQKSGKSLDELMIFLEV